MLKVYRMPNGRRYQFEDGKVPEGAVLVGGETKVEEKVAPKPKNKARKTEKK